MKKARLINSLLVMLCGLLGGSSSFIVGNILFSNYSPNSFLVSLIILQLIVILIFLVTLRYQVKKTNSELLVPLSIVVFVIFLLFAPVIVNKLDYYLSIPSVKEQNQAITETSNILNQTNIPYSVDEEESKVKTKEDGLRVNIVLVKKEEGFFNKGEIELFLEMLPKREIHLTFYTSGKADVFVLAIDDEKNIFTCSPFEICKEMGINY